MKRILVALTSVAFVVGSHVLPADAITWPPGTPYRSVIANCAIDVTSGDFGQSFANAETVSSGCQDVFVKVTAVVPTGSHIGITPWCSLADVVFHGNTTYCTFLFRNGILGVQAHLPGSTGWLQTDFRLCTSPTVCSGIRTLTRL